MPIPVAFLLGMQASGMIVDWLGREDQIRLGKMGAKIEQAGIESTIQTTRLESEQASLESMKQLRQNLGTQAAMLAARGTRAGTGNAVLGMSESVGNFNADERMRRLNLMSKEAGLKAGKLMSKLHENTYQSKVHSEFAMNALKKLPTSQEAWSNLAKGFSKENKYGFGLTKV